MVLGTEVLGPEKNDIVYTEKYKGNLEAGYYKITGAIVARNKPISGSLVIKIKLSPYFLVPSSCIVFRHYVIFALLKQKINACKVGSDPP